MDPGEAGCLNACRQLSSGGCCSDTLIGTCAELDPSPIVSMPRSTN